MSEPAAEQDERDEQDEQSVLPFFTDLAYANTLSGQVEGRLIHVTGRGWLSWDGARWRENQKAAERESKKFASHVLDQAVKQKDQDAAKKALGRTAESKIRATLKLAESDTRVSVEPHTLDADLDLLNTASGVVHLRDGALYEHDPKLHMTKLAGAVYDPGAESDRWVCFLEEATGGDDELTAWLQRFAGYAATGHATEEVVAFLHGPGATGKTTWCEAIRAALGSYAATAEFASFLSGRSDGSAASPDIARLEGVRAAFASEVNPGQRFNPQRLKSLTGGETITARRLYRDPIEFRPQFSLILAANERPAIPADDSAAWRRIRLVPFDRVVPPDERSPTLKDKLVKDHDERMGVLAWIVQGAIDWYAHGLGTCPAIDTATSSYRLANDTVARWLATACELEPEASTPAGDLREHYEHWCVEADEQPVTPQAYRSALEGHGLRRHKAKAGLQWHGVQVAGAPGAAGAPPHRDFPIHARAEDSTEGDAPDAPGAPEVNR